MLLSPAGIIMHRLLQEFRHHADIEMHAFVVMPDHIHVLFTIHSRPHGKAISRKFGDLIPHEQCSELTETRIWQRNYYESLISENAIERVRRYILNNPRNWKG